MCVCVCKDALNVSNVTVKTLINNYYYSIVIHSTLVLSKD